MLGNFSGIRACWVLLPRDGGESDFCAGTRDQAGQIIFTLKKGEITVDRFSNRSNRECEHGNFREIERYFILFLRECIWEIRINNPSLAVKILNGTPKRAKSKGLVSNSQ